MRPSPEYKEAFYLYSQSDNFGNPSQSSLSYYPVFRYYVGARTPDYGARKRTHTLPMNNFLSDVVRMTSTGKASYTTAENPMGATMLTNPVHFLGDTPLHFVVASVRTEMQNKATLKLYSAVRGVEVNLAQFFAERKQTADLLANTATRIAQGALALKRADLRGFANSLSLSAAGRSSAKRMWKKVESTPTNKRLASHWLEFVFGWQPLLTDMHDAASLLAESVAGRERPEGRLKVQAHSRQTGKYTQPRGQSTGGLMLKHYEDTESTTCRITVDYEIEDDGRAVLSKTGISNPALLAWELLPFSFVVDWALPVGTYLESLTALDGFQIKSGSLSFLETVVSDRTVFTSNAGESQYNFIKASGGSVLATQARYQRISTKAFLYALRVKSPIGGEPLKRFTTAMALLTLLFR